MPSSLGSAFRSVTNRVGPGTASRGTSAATTLPGYLVTDSAVVRCEHHQCRCRSWCDGRCAELLIGGPGSLYVVVFGTVSVLAQIFLKYERYVAILKWLTLVLFAYVIALFMAEGAVERGTRRAAIPTIQCFGNFTDQVLTLFAKNL